MRTWIFVAALVLVGLSNMGGCNFFYDIAIRTSDEAKVDDIKNLIDQQQWTAAITEWNTLSAAGQAGRDNKVLLASAYAGRGGLNVLTIANNMASMVGTPFQIMMEMFTGATIASFNDEVMAESIMQGISPTAAGRTTDENTFMLFVEMAKLGTLLAAEADTNADQVVDAAYNNCTATTNAQADHIVTGLGNIVDVTSVIGATLAGGLAPLLAACGGLGGMCAITDTASVTAMQERIAKTLAGETAQSIGLAAATTAGQCELALPVFCPGAPVPNNLCP